MSNNNNQNRIIAMWSGPRNLSTAMMRSFSARGDCHAMDEPFYAAYLAKTKFKHPMYQEIIDDGETDPLKVVEQCLATPPAPNSITYQKHMTHHMIDGFDLSWTNKVTNVFLIREPKRVLASYAKKHADVTATDTGIIQQREIYDLAKSNAQENLVVIDAIDVRANPEAMLKALCEAINIDFTPNMLSWEKGEKPEDGIWASHWYDAVWKTTSFAPPEKDFAIELPKHLAEMNKELEPHYQTMRRQALQI